MITPQAHQKQRVIQRARQVANTLAVNCHTTMREIESVPGWQRHPILSHWWAMLAEARTVLTQAEPSPSLSKVEQEIEASMREAGIEPAVRTHSGSAGGSGGANGGVSAPAAPNWLEVVGQR